MSFLFYLILLFGAFAAKPVIYFTKKVEMSFEKKQLPVVGRPLTIEYKVYNQGNEVLEDARLQDLLFDSEVVSLTIPPIHPGQFWVKDYSVAPQKMGTFIDSSATLMYAGGGEVLSNNAGMMMVLGREEYEAYFESHYKAWLAYFGILIAIITYSYHQYTQAYNILHSSSKKHK